MSSEICSPKIRHFFDIYTSTTIFGSDCYTISSLKPSFIGSKIQIVLIVKISIDCSSNSLNRKQRKAKCCFAHSNPFINVE